jgi:protein-disulfide isomerase
MRLPTFLATAATALVAGFLGAWLFAASGLGAASQRAWLLDHPEVLPAMAEKLQQREAEKRLAGVASEAYAPFPGAVLGNPQGTVTLVQFSDYGCTYCRQNLPLVHKLLADNPDVRVVMREWPIFAGSDMAARMALAAARQGKYAAFHDAMYAAGPPSTATISSAATAAGLDIAAAQAFAASPQAELELRKNQEIAAKLGFQGTPSWIAGKRVLEGFLDAGRLEDAVRAARPS